MPWPKTGATQYYAQLRLLDKGRAINRFVVWRTLGHLTKQVLVQRYIKELFLGVSQPQRLSEANLNAYIFIYLFQNNLLRVFMGLLGQELFTDVTIASEGRRIKCHKVTVVSVKVPFREQPPPLHGPYFEIIKKNWGLI